MSTQSKKQVIDKFKTHDGDTGSPDGTIKDTSADWVIGSDGGQSQPLDFYVDEPSLWSGAVLSSTDVTTLYNSGVPTDVSAASVSATLVEWWRNGDDPDDSLGTGIQGQLGDFNLGQTNMEHPTDIVEDVP